MDQGTWVGVVTATVMLAFLVACIWALLPAQKKRFAEAAQLPLEEHETTVGGPEIRAPQTASSAKQAAAKEERA